MVSLVPTWLLKTKHGLTGFADDFIWPESKAKAGTSAGVQEDRGCETRFWSAGTLAEPPAQDAA